MILFMLEFNLMWLIYEKKMWTPNGGHRSLN